MDTEQAKVILSNFRPNGQDANDADFAEALALAAQDRRLGEWLACERAKDAAFSDALNSVRIPEDLRAEILAAINDDVAMEDDPELDEAFFGAFADVQPHQGLRDQILVAMDQEQKVVKGNFFNWRVMAGAAAAVVALLAVFLFVPLGPAPSAFDQVFNDSDDARVHAYDIQQKVGMKLVRDDIKLVSNSFTESMQWLEEKNLPVPEVPKKLKSMKCMGATAVDIGEGVNASLLRFLSEDGKQVNMLVIDRENVENADKLPHCSGTCAQDSYWCPNCDYWIARMQAKDTTVILLSQLDRDSTTGIF